MSDGNNSKIIRFTAERNAVLMLGNGIFFYGFGCGKKDRIIGEICFNTAMTGYQEILTDLSYHGQIICFTNPHIGNTGANHMDWENLYETQTQTQTQTPMTKAAIFRNSPTSQSNYRAECNFDKWLEKFNITAISGIDTRMITRYISQNGMMNAALVYEEKKPDVKKLWQELQSAPDMQGLELTRKVIARTSLKSNRNNQNNLEKNDLEKSNKPKIAVLDFGCKANIALEIEKRGIEVVVIKADSSLQDILNLEADGYMLSNGPGDPCETSKYAKETILNIIKTKKPVYGVCLGHQLIALALGGRTEKMKYGHHGANHPVKNLQHDRVMICSMNHGFAVDRKTLPANIVETHVSLFDGSNCGFKTKDGKIASVQYHPEANPGPNDAKDFFDSFEKEVKKKFQKNQIENKKLAVSE